MSAVYQVSPTTTTYGPFRHDHFTEHFIGMGDKRRGIVQPLSQRHPAPLQYRKSTILKRVKGGAHLIDDDLAQFQHFLLAGAPPQQMVAERARPAISVAAVTDDGRIVDRTRSRNGPSSGWGGEVQRKGSSNGLYLSIESMRTRRTKRSQKVPKRSRPWPAYH